MAKCLLCLSKILKRNSVKVDVKNEFDMSLEDLIKNLFWFYDKIPINSAQSIVCKSCSEHLHTFHDFFSIVKSNYKVTDTHPIDTNLIFVKDEVPDVEIVIKQDPDEDTFIAYTMSPYHDESSSGSSETQRKRKRDKSVDSEEGRPQKLARNSVTVEEFEVLRPHADFKCEKCSEELKNDWFEIMAHYRNFHKVHGYLRCCGRKIDRAHSLKEHASWHLNPNIFQCQECGKILISLENLRIHQFQHVRAEDRPFSCPKCGKKFVKQYSLNLHFKNHDKDGKLPTIPCKFCEKLFPTSRQLNDHVKHCHSDNSYMCYVCTKTFKAKSSLNYHIRDHMNADDSIECDLCGHVLKNKRQFQRHLKKHKSEAAGPYLCEKGCGKLFRNQSAMRNHIAFVHTTKSFSCSLCEKVFKHKKTLDEHVLAQHQGLDLYKCPFCDRMFKNNGNMHSHKKKAHPEEYKRLPAPRHLGGTLGDHLRVGSE